MVTGECLDTIFIMMQTDSTITVSASILIWYPHSQTYTQVVISQKHEQSSRPVGRITMSVITFGFDIPTTFSRPQRTDCLSWTTNAYMPGSKSSRKLAVLHAISSPDTIHPYGPVNPPVGLDNMPLNLLWTISISASVCLGLDCADCRHEKETGFVEIITPLMNDPRDSQFSVARKQLFGCQIQRWMKHTKVVP